MPTDLELIRAAAEAAQTSPFMPAQLRAGLPALARELQRQAEALQAHAAALDKLHQALPAELYERGI